MARTTQHRKKRSVPVPADLAGMMDAALARGDDLIITIESDPDTGSRRMHAFSGKFISPCMLRKLTGLAESQADEGSRMISGDWA